MSDQATDYLATLLAEAEDLLEAGDAAGAVALLERSIAQAQDALAVGPQGLLCAALGDVHRRGGAMEAALLQYERAATCLHEVGDTSAEAGALLRCGDAQRALKRVGAATQSYNAAAAIYQLLDDPRGAAHGEFLLAELAAGVNREIAEKHYTRAVELYHEAAEREDAVAADDGALPEHTGDPRLLDSAQMAAVAQRQLEQLPHLPARPAEPPGAWTPPAQPAAPTEHPPTPAARDEASPTPDAYRPSALLLGTLAIGICGLLLLAAQWIERAPLVSAAAGILALGFTVLAVRRSAALSPYLGYGAAGLAWLLLLASGARPILRQSAPAEPTAQAAAPTHAPVPVAHEPWTPERQRAAFARELAAVAGDARREADVLHRHGEFECYEGARRRCRELWEQSVERYQAADAPALAADMAMRIGDLHLRGRRPAPARQRFASAATLYEAARNPRQMAHALRRRGDAEAALQQWPEAIASYREALRLLRQQRDGIGEIRIILSLAAIERRIGSAERTRKLLYRALRLSVSNGPLHARVWLALAELEAAQQVDVAALRAYDRAVSLAGAERDPDLEARALRRWGEYERRRGLLAAARSRYEIALRLARSRDARGAEALSLLRAAELEVEAGDLLAARDFYAAADALFAERPHPTGAARVALGLGNLSAQYGDPRGAREHYTRALELAAAADHTGLQITALERLSRLLASDEPQTTLGYLDQVGALRAEAFGAG